MFLKFSFFSLLFLLNYTISSASYADDIANAQEALSKQQYSIAIKHLKNQLKNKPKDTKALFLLGDTYLRKGEIEFSIAEFEKAYNLEQNNTKILFRYADALKAAGQYQKIIKTLNQPLYETKAESQRLNSLAYAHLALNERAKAKQFFERSNKKNKNVVALNGLATLALMNRQLFQANNLLSQSLSITPGNFAALQLKARLANLNNQPQQALNIYNQLLVGNSRNLSLSLERARTLIMLKKHKQLY